MKPAALIVTLVLALVAFGCSFGGTMMALTLTQPAAPGSTAQIPFEIKSGDTANDVADRLQAQGIIRNATLFKLVARAQSLDSNLRVGTYNLSPGLSMDGIIQVLAKGAPDPGILITFAPGLRVTQYVYTKDSNGHRIDLKTKLVNFNADNFLKIATTGKYLDGSAVSQKYWFVEPLQPNAKYALEGYLFPETYSMGASYDETAVINRLLDQFGFELCPGPNDQPDDSSYFHDKTKCMSHAAVIDKTTNLTLFDAVTKLYGTSDQVLALYRALTMAGLVIREIDSHDDAPGVAGVYYNRYLESIGKLTNPPYDWVPSFGSDPSAEYGRDTDKPPTDPTQWWAPLAAAGKDVDPTNLYNTDNPYHHGLPPGPIAAPTVAEIFAAAEPTTKPIYLYFIADSCKVAKIHYATNLNQFNGIVARYLGKC